ncbi:neurohypophysial n-terminal domain containing protein [Stylonychia lemnae]|uniref:Neurohypophysial n-terminal domain containing protein n=1 Tax=Stylonychia lemnae TaxID=5949 RepID=A0A078A4M8_STYLE|nr:neurohypophysial n-terminal domain containing protein [Stylonychia lemnae]|eukprot:CDW75719.1 neurohypophysial n-terminal domain containing protein [Stylonychia lemnae]
MKINFRNNRVLSVTSKTGRYFTVDSPFSQDSKNIQLYSFWVKFDAAEVQTATIFSFVTDWKNNNQKIDKFFLTLIMEYESNEQNIKWDDNISSYQPSSQWCHVLVGWISKNENSLIVSFNKKVSQVKYAGEPRDLVHQKTLIFFNYINMKTSGRYILMGEIQFWSFPSTQFFPDAFLDRYYGISFKNYQLGKSEYLIEYYYPLDEGPFIIWNASINTNLRIEVTIPTDLEPENYEQQFIKPATHKVLCPPGYRNTFDTNNYLQTCLTCNKFCVECSQLDEKACLVCNPPFNLKDARCVKDDCLVGSYYDPDIYECMPCSEPCSMCSSLTKCLYCIPGFLYVDDGSNSCVSQADGCPNGTFPDKHGMPVCNKCQQNCADCNSYDNCTSCTKGSRLSKGKCSLSYCGSETYFDPTTETCRSCPANCSSCISNICTDCIESTVYKLGKCVETCGDGYYQDPNKNLCLQCYQNCQTCNFTDHTCYSCKQGFYLFNNTCISRCPYVGYFENSTSRVCEPCDMGCEICINSPSDCITCLPGVLQGDRKCVTSCEVKQYQSITGKCYPCDDSCEECFGSQFSECSKCSDRFYLLGSSCIDECPTPFYADEDARICKECKYFCDKCSNSDFCEQCKYGYPQLTSPVLNCSGEYYLRTNTSKILNLPLNPIKFQPTSELDSITVELWFKADNINSQALEIILGMSPYKLRKKFGQNTIDILFMGSLIYCGTEGFDLSSENWIHFAFSISKTLLSFNCYLNGQSYSIGDNAAFLVAQNLQKPQEITLGGTVYPSGPENPFVGYFKEFRFWNVVRNQFEIDSFKFVDVSMSKSSLFAYWKLSEPNDGTVQVFTDSAADNLKFDPTIPTTFTSILALNANHQTVQKLMEFREIYLKICPKGQYPMFDEKIGYYICNPCHSNCLNCIGPNINQCIQCELPLKLIQDSRTCEIIQSCPNGLFMDKVTGLCRRCDDFCQSCKDDPSNCDVCKLMAFRQYNGPSCVNKCPSGMYGNHEKQKCFQNPRINYITPETDSLFSIEDFIDIKSSYTMLNSEPNNTFNIGWIITRQKGSLDITYDVIKTYYQTDLTRVHLDSNVLQANNYYTLTFFVKGNDTFYKDLYVTLSHEIYVGIQPRSGKCAVTPLIGIAQVTKFQIKQQNWIDNEPIDRYDFSYSMDGEIFIPIDSSTTPNLNYTFSATYQRYTNVIFKCTVVNVKGFQNSALATISLEKKSSADASVDLQKFKTDNLENEISYLQALSQLKLITQYLGDLPNLEVDRFDPKLEAQKCDDKLCNYIGICIYQPFNKKYYCNCSEPFGGLNCSYSNRTQISVIQKYQLELAFKYNMLATRAYEIEFLKICTYQIEQINDGSFGLIVQIINSKMIPWENQPQSQETLKIFLMIASNLLEYIEKKITLITATTGWKNDTTLIENIQESLQQVMAIVAKIRQNQLEQVSMLDPLYQYQTRMISFKQMLINQDTLILIQASNTIKKSQRTAILISPNNFDDPNLALENEFILEAIEYAINPYQIINSQNISNNVFEVNFYNLSTLEKATIKNLNKGFEFSYPFQDNQNLSEFMQTYNSLSPYKAAQNYKRIKMLNQSEISCTYWNGTQWSKNGCQFIGVDLTHIKCLCNHLSAFSPIFHTPVEIIAQEVEQLPAQYKSAEDEENGKITKEDLIVPFDRYFKNLEELLQHKTPSPIDFMFKPGIYVVLAFWFMYISGLVYYSGRDRKNRQNMTKKQIRNDLAEIPDKEIQCLQEVINEILIQEQMAKDPKVNYDDTKSIDNLFDTSSLKQSNDGLKKYNDADEYFKSTNKLKLYEELTKEQQKDLRRKAKAKVFGRAGTPFQRANRFYKQTIKHHPDPNERKMVFFNESLKNTLWMSLMSKNSKISPRHVRLTLLYLNISLHLLISSFGFAFGYYDIVQQTLQNTMYIAAACATGLVIAPWIIAIPVALILRIPMSLRRQIEGVKTRMINKAFDEIDKQMGCRYAVGYFICYFFYFAMTAFVIFFNYLYPAQFCMDWLFIIIVTYFLDIVVFTFGYAGLQLILTVVGSKIKFFFKVWRMMELFRYYKNLRG